MRTLFLLCLVGCSGRGEESADTGVDVVDDVADALPGGVVDLSGAARLIAIEEEVSRRTVTELGAATLYKELETGEQVPLFPEDWWVSTLATGGDQMAVRFRAMWAFPFADGGGFQRCGTILFSTGELDTAPAYCVLPLELYAACTDVDPIAAQEAWCTEDPNWFDLGPDGTLWAYYPKLDENFEPEGWVLYAYQGGVVTRVTPLVLLTEADLKPVLTEGGILFPNNGQSTIESYWIDPDDSAAIQMYTSTQVATDQLGNFVTYAGRVLGRDPTNSTVVLSLDPTTRSWVDLVPSLTFPATAPTTVYLRAVDGDAIYLEAPSGDIQIPDQLYRCDADRACAAVAADDPRYLLLKDATELLSDGQNTYVRTATGHFFLHDGTVSEDVSNTIQILEVRVMGGVLHFVGVNADNVGGTFRVDFDGTSFVYTQLDTTQGEVLALVPLDGSSGS